MGTGLRNIIIRNRKRADVGSMCKRPKELSIVKSFVGSNKNVKDSLRQSHFGHILFSSD